MSARDAKKRWLNVVRYFQFCPIFKQVCGINFPTASDSLISNIFFNYRTKLKIPSKIKPPFLGDF